MSLCLPPSLHKHLRINRIYQGEIPPSKQDHHILLIATMKMAGLLWLSASVLLLQSCSCIDEEQLSPVVDEIWKNYKVNNMFSIAASIPKKENQEDEYDVSQVLNTEEPEAVKTAMKKKEVYMHGRIVAATVTKNPDVEGDVIPAEYRVLQNFDNLLNQKFDYDNDLMLFYDLAAPCVQKCTDENNPENILKYLPKLKRWTHYAFAFSGLYLSRDPQESISDEQRRAGVQKVAGSLGLENVFRCVESDGQMQCRSCADQNNQHLSRQFKRIIFKALMKMEGLLWMSVITSVMLLQSCSCIDDNPLAQMVNVIWRNYRPGKMFSIAASIPKKANAVDRYDFEQVLNAENAKETKEIHTQSIEFFRTLTT
ncbi:hypothetical protein OJAV_G00009850 [Oryzias javanicus]|uniref:Uncharacterized protein n=1 Tax=Oryzias javanicus TaxID=123683 RepID=A0A3S2MI85_ORYJA|nr:hypothetical protein OJAV_G00009850 [Oryzias javanicus]